MVKATRVRRSFKMNEEQRQSLEKFVEEQPTKTDAAEVLGISRPTLNRIMVSGGGKEEVIKRVINKVQEA